ncbi:MAG: HlyD family type I secretion periplasmic adaptor subunit [Pseudomonadota bacterium]
MRLWSKRDEDKPKQSKKATWPAWRPLLLGALVTAALVYGLGYWANQAMISGAVIASGELRVETRRKVVSHFDGGVVAEIAVREGDTVEAGDLLLQLDATELAADLEILEAEHDALLARQARLTAERDEQRDIEIAPVLAERLRSRPQLENAIAGQRRLFKARRNTHLQQQAQFRVRNEQLQNQISGGRAQIAALDDQLELIKEEIADQTSLLDRGLTPKTRVTALLRNKAGLLGERGARVAENARLRGQISEAELRRLELVAERREAAIEELRTNAERRRALIEERGALADRLGRMTIVAPQDGTVFNLTAHTIGGVISPAQAILEIVPGAERLIVEARVEALFRDQVRAGQEAVVKFPGFNQNTTPEVSAEVLKISGDALADPNTGMSFFVAELVIAQDELGRLRKAIGVDLSPGMPAEAYIATEVRSASSWLLKPLRDSFDRALRED